MTNEQQYDLYTKAFTLILDHPEIFRTFPLDTDLLCEALGIELHPLSGISRAARLPREALFRIWGNEDGVILTYKDRPKIAYNDQKMRQRQRFTICEEVSHYILGHTGDPRFNIFSQDYDPYVYQCCEEEARICAGILLCQPQYFYKNPKQMTPVAISRLCDISWDCALTRYDTLLRFREAVMSHHLYDQLPQPRLSLGDVRSRINARQAAMARKIIV